MAGSSNYRRPEGLRSFLCKQVYRHLWGMDLDPTSRIATSAYIDRTWPRGVHVGASTVIDEEAVVLTHDLTRGVRFDTRIGAGCYIGARAIIMPGVSIGDGAIVRPGSVVTRNVASGSTVSGNPARELGEDAQQTATRTDCGKPKRRRRRGS